VAAINTFDFIKLTRTSDSRAFLKKALEFHYERQGKINLSDFSRKVGFSSRSYLSEFLAKKKGLSRDSVLRIKSALKLPPLYRRFFELLVYRDQPELMPKNLLLPDVLEQIKSMQERLAAEVTKEFSPRNVSNIVKKAEIYQVYAALGKVGVGATLDEILKRTGLEKPVIQDVLEILKNEKALIQVGDRNIPISSQLDFLGLSASDGLTDLTRQVCNAISKNAAEIISQNENHVFFTAFSMNKADALKYKKKLREVVYEVIEQFQVEDGDSIQQLFLTSR